METPNQDIRLQVLICTLGDEGIRRVAAACHPQVCQVEYLVSWQLPEGDLPVPEALQRPDFRIVKSYTRGLSRNRNAAIEAASAPLCLISDDDVIYNADNLQGIIRHFDENPETDILTFRYASASEAKTYPDRPFPLDSPPKGYYASSIEIAFRRDSVAGKIRFNENFGIGARFIAGEEDIFIYDALRAGLSGRYIPFDIARHDDLSTSARLYADPALITAKGAVFTHIHPASWPLRMLVHALRNIKNNNGISTFRYLKSWLNGAFSN